MTEEINNRTRTSKTALKPSKSRTTAPPSPLSLALTLDRLVLRCCEDRNKPGHKRGRGYYYFYFYTYTTKRKNYVDFSVVFWVVFVVLFTSDILDVFCINK